MSTIEKLIRNKARDIWTIAPDDTVYEAIKQMNDHSVGALPVTAGGKLVGIISERDYARKVILKDRSSKQTRVREIMTTRVFHTFPDQKIEECMAVMSEHHIRHLPVLDNEKLVGIISIGDVVKDIISEQQFKIEQLENTITWSETY
ncbi:MAG: CBS domain-containing protein [Gammaproteobacteria bacterium]|nr:CBS domain-containing protein [Gammaproteobacteria bacterium]